jgi:flagellar hook-basal body complex protein FliE
VTVPIAPVSSLGALASLGGAQALPSMRLRLLDGADGADGRLVGVEGPGTAGNAGSDFAGMVSKAVSTLSATQDRADAYAQQAAAGRLENVAEYMVAATEAQLTTQLAVTLRNRAVEAYQEIMRMPV